HVYPFPHGDWAHFVQHAGALDVRIGSGTRLGYALLLEVLPPLRGRRRHNGLDHPHRLRYSEERADHRRFRCDFRTAAGLRHALSESDDPVYAFVPDPGEILRHDYRRHRVSDVVPIRRWCKPRDPLERHAFWLSLPQ